MSAVARLRASGFTVRLTDAGRLGITPAARLSDGQRTWLAEHRGALLAELRAEAANDAAGTIEPACWGRFLDACERLGLHRDVVADEFTDDDRADLLDTYADDDVRLHRCAETLAGDRRLIAASARLRQGERCEVAS